MFLNGIMETLAATLVAQFYIVNDTHTADDRAGVENLMEIWGNDSFKLLTCTFLKLLASICILITSCRSGHIAVHLTIPVERVLQFFVLTELGPNIVNELVGNVAES